MTIKRIYADEDDCQHKGAMIGYWDSKEHLLDFRSRHIGFSGTPEEFIQYELQGRGSESPMLYTVARQVPVVKRLIRDFKKTCERQYKKEQTVAYRNNNGTAGCPLTLITLKEFNGFYLNCNYQTKKKELYESWEAITSTGYQITAISLKFEPVGEIDKWEEGKKIALEAKRKIKAAGCRGFQIIYEGKIYTVN